MYTIFLALLGISLIPILIIALFPKKESFFEKSSIKGFGLGVYLMLVILLLKEATVDSNILNSGSWFLIGLLVSLLIGILFKEFHHHHNPEEKAHSHNKSSIWRILISDFQRRSRA